MSADRFVPVPRHVIDTLELVADLPGSVVQAIRVVRVADALDELSEVVYNVRQLRMSSLEHLSREHVRESARDLGQRLQAAQATVAEFLGELLAKENA